jgi:hypothetical protein
MPSVPAWFARAGVGAVLAPRKARAAQRAAARAARGHARAVTTRPTHHDKAGGGGEEQGTARARRPNPALTAAARGSAASAA